MARKQAITVALDIGTHKTSVLVAAVEPGGVQVLGAGSAPSHGLKRGMVVNIDTTVHSIERAVHEAESMADCEIHSVIASLSGNHVRGFNSHGMVPIKTREVTAGDVEHVLDAARAVALPADREVLHVLPQEYIIDDQDGITEPQGMAGVRLEARVHVLTGSTAAAQNVVKCCNRAGLAVSQVVLSPLASATAVLSDEERDLGVALIDVGGGTSDLIVYHGGSVRHTAVLGLGGSQLTNDIAAGLRTPAVEAEKLKQRYGSAISESIASEETLEVPSVGGRGPRVLSRQILAEIIEPRVEEILTLVSRELVRAGVEGMLASGVVLTGGTASLDGIARLAEKVFDVPVRIGAPADVGGLADLVSGPAYSTAIGLLLIAGRNGGEGGGSYDGAAGVFSKVKHRMGDWLREFF
ncbi:MAG TPA: cell division protein FtsA [Candidatus Binatia bacterium]|nr:cell division protein FtsA [Candidatus Binatia bacterium]